jgi:hypothetical protein
MGLKFLKRGREGVDVFWGMCGGGEDDFDPIGRLVESLIQPIEGSKYFFNNIKRLITDIIT